MTGATECSLRHQVEYTSEAVVPDQHDKNTRITATLLRVIVNGGVHDDHDNLNVVFTGALLDTVRAVLELRELVQEAAKHISRACEPICGSKIACAGCFADKWLKRADAFGLGGI